MDLGVGDRVRVTVEQGRIIKITKVEDKLLEGQNRLYYHTADLDAAHFAGEGDGEPGGEHQADRPGDKSDNGP